MGTARERKAALAASLVAASLPAGAQAPPGTAVAALNAPSCQALTTWSVSQDFTERLSLSPTNCSLGYPAPLATPAFQELFGKLPLAWTANDVAQADRMLRACGLETRKARNAPTMKALTKLHGSITQPMWRTVQGIKAAQKRLDMT